MELCACCVQRACLSREVIRPNGMRITTSEKLCVLVRLSAPMVHLSGTKEVQGHLSPFFRDTYIVASHHPHAAIVLTLSCVEGIDVGQLNAIIYADSSCSISADNSLCSYALHLFLCNQTGGLLRRQVYYSHVLISHNTCPAAIL